MAARRNGKNRSSAKLRSFGPLLNQRPTQGLLAYNSWQAQVFIEMLGTMLTEQEFSDVVLQPIIETYARFVREARRNIWSLSFSHRLIVRMKYLRHAQRLVELLGAILPWRQFNNMILNPIIMTFIELYAKFVLDISLTGDGLQNSKTLIDIDWNCTVEAFSSTPYRKIRLNESTCGNSRSELLPCD
ncbi:uncharacterized protein LOC118748527 [Rhagoletis pomonella]|uniref:uncharacterized protein LOC118748527 n=1 Tax=Rhagoletis pomonella TaxID=28610 RepID=UPI00177BEFDB|nr:uncharacterized protein LOC118748527 [Rhagoletis pomonella]